MNNFHEQAMSSVYQQVLHRLLGFFSRSERIALQLLIQRLLVAAGGGPRRQASSHNRWLPKPLSQTCYHFATFLSYPAAILAPLLRTRGYERCNCNRLSFINASPSRAEFF